MSAIVTKKTTSAEAARAANARDYTAAPEDRKYTAWVVNRSGESYGETPTSIARVDVKKNERPAEIFNRKLCGLAERCAAGVDCPPIPAECEMVCEDGKDRGIACKVTPNRADRK